MTMTVPPPGFAGEAGGGMSIRTWTDGLSRLDIEREPSGRIRFGLHGTNDDGEVIEYGFVASFSAAAREEIAQFIKDGM